MGRISATEFRAKCLDIIEEVRSTGDTIVIEKRGKPVVQLTTYIPLETTVPHNPLPFRAIPSRFLKNVERV